MFSKKLTPAEAGGRAARRDSYEPKSDEVNPDFLFQCTHTELLLRCARGEFDLREMAKKELANRGLNLQGQWIRFKSKPKAENICPGCDGDGGLISGNSKWKVYSCNVCAGLFTPAGHAIPIHEALKYVNFLEWASEREDAETENILYYDLVISFGTGSSTRVHGWFNSESKKKVQEG